MIGSTPEKARMRLEMFALSFAALFLEMMVIRWVPSVVHLVAYYANLMLLSSFLGLGAGAMASGRRWNLFGWFPVFLACQMATLLLCRNAVLGSTANEARFFQLAPSTFNGFVLVSVFAVNALMFVPLGQRMGVLFNALPRLSAYSWDLAGGLVADPLLRTVLAAPVLARPRDGGRDAGVPGDLRAEAVASRDPRLCGRPGRRRPWRQPARHLVPLLLHHGDIL